MTKNKTLTPDEALSELYAFAYQDGLEKIRQDHPYHRTEAKQAILQWVADTCIGDDSDTPNVMIAMEHNRQRQILRAAGWKPSDKEDV